MARITVEDCLKYIPNRFELVLIAAKKARRISRGGASLVPGENDKPTVLALREIAAGFVEVVEDRIMGDVDYDKNAELQALAQTK